MVFFKENKFLLLLTICLLFFFGTYILSYDCDYYDNDYSSKKNIKFTKDKFINNNSNKPVLSLYYAKWCGHCNTFKPTWEQIKNDQNNLNFVDFNTVDCSGDSKETSIYNTPNGTELDGFPTIILSIDNKDKIYNGQRNKKAIEDYLKKELLI